MNDNTFKTLTAKGWEQLTEAERHAYDDECQRRMDADTRARIKADDHTMKQRARRAARRIGLIARISKSRKLSDDNFGEFMVVDPHPVWAFVTGTLADGSDWVPPKDEYEI